jgi:SAM-dependent methyltransferase
MSNIPRVKGQRRLDVGWEQGEIYPGSTLGLDVPYGVPFSNNPEDIEKYRERMRNWPHEGGDQIDPGTHKYIQEGIQEGEFDPSFEHVYGSGTSLPYRTGSLDVYTSDHSLGMNFDTFEGLEEAIRVLRSGGKLFVRYPIGREEAKEIREWLKTQPVTKVRLGLQPWTSDIPIEDREEEGRNWVLRFTKV